MKFIIILASITALVLAEDVEHKKRGLPKTSQANAISNGHQKVEHVNYQQTGAVPHSPVYPLTPTSYTPEQQVAQQAAFSFLPQQPHMLFYPQPVAAPRYQLFATKNANGQTQLTLMPQSLFYTPQNYLTLQSPVVPNQLSAQQQATLPTQSSPHAQNYYSTPAPQSIYQPLPFGQNPVVGQPSTMFIFAQPAPQLYNNYVNPQSNLLYTPAGQQLLNYYQTNPQAKNQLLYGNSAYPQQAQVNAYQPPVSVEIEKSIPGPVQQNPSGQKIDSHLTLNTNEYIPAETQFRPLPSYGSRTSSNYKN